MILHIALCKNSLYHVHKFFFSLDYKQLEGRFCVCTSLVPEVQYRNWYRASPPKIIFLVILIKYSIHTKEDIYVHIQGIKNNKVHIIGLTNQL